MGFPSRGRAVSLPENSRSPSEKIIVLGGNVGLLDGEDAETQCGNITPRVYPAGVARHVLRAAQNHCRGNLPDAPTRGRVWGVPAVQNSPAATAREFPPTTWAVFSEKLGFPLRFQG